MQDGKRLRSKVSGRSAILTGFLKENELSGFYIFLNSFGNKENSSIL